MSRRGNRLRGACDIIADFAKFIGYDARAWRSVGAVRVGCLIQAIRVSGCRLAVLSASIVEAAQLWIVCPRPGNCSRFLRSPGAEPEAEPAAALGAVFGDAVGENQRASRWASGEKARRKVATALFAAAAARQHRRGLRGATGCAGGFRRAPVRRTARRRAAGRQSPAMPAAAARRKKAFDLHPGALRPGRPEHLAQHRKPADLADDDAVQRDRLGRQHEVEKPARRSSAARPRYRPGRAPPPKSRGTAAR